MFILEIDATKITGAENNKSASGEIKNPDSILLKALSQTLKAPEEPFQDISNDGIANPIRALNISTETAPEMIEKLLNEYVNSIIANEGNFKKTDLEVFSNLAVALRVLTQVDEFVINKMQLQEFFKSKAFKPSTDPNDIKPTLDYRGLKSIEPKDIIEFWKSLDHPQKPQFTKFVHIDLDKDGKYDYKIQDGKFFKITPSSNTNQGPIDTEVGSIPGIDLLKLSNQLKWALQDFPDTIPLYANVGFYYDADENGIPEGISIWASNW